MSAKANLVLDAVIGAAFLVAANPPLTGQGVHEWLGVAFAAATVTHVVFHWNWVAHAPRRRFARAARGFRLDDAVAAWLFVALTATILSGLLTSKQLMAFLGLTAAPRPWWRESTRWGRTPCWRGWGCISGCTGTGWHFTLGDWRAPGRTQNPPNTAQTPPRPASGPGAHDERRQVGLEVLMLPTIGRVACIAAVGTLIAVAIFFLSSAPLAQARAISVQGSAGGNPAGGRTPPTRRLPAGAIARNRPRDGHGHATASGRATASSRPDEGSAAWA